jgi:hypothetical protein
LEDQRLAAPSRVLIDEQADPGAYASGAEAVPAFNSVDMSPDPQRDALVRLLEQVAMAQGLSRGIHPGF